MSEGNLFEQGSIRRTYVTLALPVTLGMVLSVVYNVADTYFIARTQNTDLVAAISLCAPVFMLLMAFGNVFGQGGTSLISRLFGRKDEAGTRRVSAFCFYGALAAGAVLGAVMLLLPGPILGLLGANEATYAHAYPYFMTLAAGAPLVVVSFVHMNLLRAEGLSRESMVGSALGLAVNIILDPLMITTFGWGAFGAALASVIGYAVSDIFLLLVVVKKSRILTVRPRGMLLPRRDVFDILAIGASAALTNIMSSLCLILLNQFLLPYGNDQVAAMGIAQKISMVILLVITGMSFGAAPIVGYYYGGGQTEKLKQLLRFLFRTVCGTALGMTAALLALTRPCVSLFLKDPAVMEAAVRMVRWQIITMALSGAFMIITICFQASGKPAEALLSSVCRQGIVFFAVIVVLAKLLGYDGVLMAQAVTDTLSAALLGWLFYRRFYRFLR